MEINVFERIQSGLYVELEKQGFGPAVPLEEEDGGQSVYFATESVAYGLRYVPGKKQFELRSANLKVDGTPSEWRVLSSWLFDYQTSDRSDADSILNDFLEVVQGPKRVAMVQQKRTKRGKDDERVVDSLFFFNRLANMFPEIKEALNQEKSTYGQVGAVTFTKGQVVPQVEQLVTLYPDSEAVTKLAALLDDMYRMGDLDLRCVVTSVLFNGLSDGAFGTLKDKTDEELQKALRFSRKLKGKKIKPEKTKKQGKKIESRLES